MTSEKEKMLVGQLYDAGDAELTASGSTPKNEVV